VVSVHANPSLEPIVLLEETGKFALAMLSQTLLLLVHVPELFILALQHLVVAIHLGHDDGIRSVGRLLIGWLGRSHRAPALLLSLLKDVNLPLRHGQLDSHATRRLLTLHGGHIVLQLVMRCRQSHMA